MLFGVEAPKMIVNIDTTQDEVLLDYSVILKDEPELDTYGVKAVRTGKQVFTNAGKHWIFQVKIHLWKYDNPKAKYLELKSYEGTLVYLYRHADGEPIFDTYNNQGKFILETINESYTDEVNKYDVIILTFRSADFINVNLKYIPPEFFEPPDLPNLNLWFADDSLTNPSSNNFEWLDKISGTTKISGNYGTGAGIVQVNGLNVLNTVGSTACSINSNFLNCEEYSFIGFIKNNYPLLGTAYKCHRIYAPAGDPPFPFTSFVNNTGYVHFYDDNPIGLQASVFGPFFTEVLGSNFDGYSISSIPYLYTIVVIRVKRKSDGGIDVYLNNNHYADDFVYDYRPFTIYNLTGASDDPYAGILGEFMYYSRYLSNAEINLIGAYYKRKYDIDWIEI